MKIGYPCINLSLKCRSSHTFRLKNYTENKLIETISTNLNCLEKILDYNRENNLLFFRITSDLIPFASHPVMNFGWQDYFKSRFREIGSFIKTNRMRITMHPGQYTVLNSIKPEVYQNAVKELKYHAEVLDLLNLDNSAKIQLHVGGVYGNKEESINRFINHYLKLDDMIKSRLVIENDDKSYNLRDCETIHKKVDIPITLDVYHLQCYNSGESLREALQLSSKTWKKKDGLPIIHYSSEHPLKGKCRHAESLDLNHFRSFLKESKDFNFDIMFELKEKEISTLKALKILNIDKRFNRDSLNI